MLRRDARLRKEFLYRKAIERESKSLKDKEAQLGSILTHNQTIPGELKSEALGLLQDINYNGTTKDSADDEYLLSGIRDPKIMITTSRDPSIRLQQFAKELRILFPNSQRINRGNYVLKDIVSSCKSGDFTDLVIVHEHRGIPDGLIVSHFPFGPTAFFTLSNVVLRHDVKEAVDKKASEAYPHLICSGFSSTVGSRTKDILRNLFPVPKKDSKRVISLIAKEDQVLFRNHIYSSSHAGATIDLQEIGPRFSLKIFQIRQGTLDNDDADIEWIFRPYINTARKRTIL